MQFSSKRADLLERSLQGYQGYQGTDQEVAALVATAGQISALTSTASAPREEFVSALGIRLRAEALTRSASRVGPAQPASAGPRPQLRPRVLVIGRRMPRLIAGATASLLLVGALVGVASRSALPGGLLYPVKQVLDSAAVGLAGSDFDRGARLLSQAQEHLSDATALVARDGSGADPASVDQAVLGARDAVSTGQRALLGEFDRTGNTQALIAVRDFVVRSLPQLEALRPVVPASSRPEVDALIALLQQTGTTVTAKVTVCGPPCASLRGPSVGDAPPTAAPTGLTSTRSGGLQPAPTVGRRPQPALPPSEVLRVPAVLGPTPAITRPGSVLGGPSVSTPRVTPRGVTGTTPPLPLPAPVPVPVPKLSPGLPALPTAPPALP